MDAQVPHNTGWRERLRTPIARRWGWVLAGVMVTLTLLQHVAWLHHSTAAETWDDDAGLVRLASCMVENLGGSDAPCSAGAPYPPLVPWITALHFMAFDERGLDVALLSLWPFLVVLGLALYAGLCRAGGVMAGLAGVALGPVLVWSLHIRGKYYTEVPLAALVVLAVVALVASRGFRDRLPSILLGAALGLGLMTKWSFAFFLGPIAAVAMAHALASPFKKRPHQLLVAAAALSVPIVLGGGAAGRIWNGIGIGVAVALIIAIGLWFVVRRWPQHISEDASARWLNVALATLGVVIIAGPWYHHYLPTMQEFLSANLAQKFHGDPIQGLAGWPFYPAVLVTRTMGTPLVILFLAGLVHAIRRSRTPLVLWSLAALLCGTLVLGILPYRAGRYLIAGLGLLVPIVVLGALHLPALGRFMAPLLLAAGLTHQVSWIPLAFDGARLPHHWAVFTLPERDLMGNTQAGLYEAYRDLLSPRWRWLPIASPPIQAKPASARIVDAVISHAGSDASLTAVVDPAGRINVNAARTFLQAHQPPITTDLESADIRAHRKSVQQWMAKARHPPDTPETAKTRAAPRRLYVVMAMPPDEHNLRPRMIALSRMFDEFGWAVVRRDGIRGAFDPVEWAIWAQPWRTSTPAVTP